MLKRWQLRQLFKPLCYRLWPPFTSQESQAGRCARIPARAFPLLARPLPLLPSPTQACNARAHLQIKHFRTASSEGIPDTGRPFFKATFINSAVFAGRALQKINSPETNPTCLLLSLGYTCQQDSTSSMSKCSCSASRVDNCAPHCFPYCWQVFAKSWWWHDLHSHVFTPFFFKSNSLKIPWKCISCPAWKAYMGH